MVCLSLIAVDIMDTHVLFTNSNNVDLNSVTAVDQNSRRGGKTSQRKRKKKNRYIYILT